MDKKEDKGLSLSPEAMVYLLHKIDRWTTRQSEFFPGYLEIVKTRKDEDGITIHINPDTGRVRKFAGRSLYNPTIEKEAGVWNIVLDLFEVEEKINVGKVKKLKSDPSRGWEEVFYLEMPYMGMPISYFEKVSPGIIARETRGDFTSKMLSLVTKYGILHPDLNYENVLVRISEGKIKLFPIDWESADKRLKGIENKPDYYKNIQLSKIRGIFEKYYPEDYK